MEKVSKFLFIALLFVSGVAFSQTNGRFKSIASFNTDSTTVKAEIAGLQLMYNNVGALYYNKQSNKWRIFSNGTWSDLDTGGGASYIFGNGLILAGDSVVIDSAKVGLKSDLSGWLTGMLTNNAAIDGASAYGINFQNISNFGAYSDSGITLVTMSGGMELINAGGAGDMQLINSGGTGDMQLINSGGTGDMRLQNTGDGGLSIRNDSSNGGSFTIENTGTGEFGIRNNSSGAFILENNGVDGISLTNNAGLNGLNFQNNSGSLTFTNNGGAFILSHSSTGIFGIEDTRVTPTGIEYIADYSANYTNRSLVDKAYVDSVAGGGGFTNSAANNELIKSDGTNGVSSGIFSSTNGNIILGSSAITGSRTITVESSSTDANLNLTPKGAGVVNTSGNGYQINSSLNNAFYSLDNANGSGFTANAFGITFDAVNGAAGHNVAISGNTSKQAAANGGDLTLRGGAAQFTGTGNGGNLILEGGSNNSGSGSPGKVYIRYEGFSIGSIGDTVSLNYLEPISETGTTRTLTADDNRKGIVSSNTLTYTIENLGRTGVRTFVMQDGVNAVTLAAGANVVLEGKTATTGDKDIISIWCYKIVGGTAYYVCW